MVAIQRRRYKVVGGMSVLVHRRLRMTGSVFMLCNLKREEMSTQLPSRLRSYMRFDLRLRSAVVISTGFVTFASRSPRLEEL